LSIVRQKLLRAGWKPGEPIEPHLTKPYGSGGTPNTAGAAKPCWKDLESRVRIESLDDINAKRERANVMRNEIAAGRSNASIAREFGVSKVFVGDIKKRMVAAGWQPGDVPDSYLTKPMEPRRDTRKHPGLSQSEINRKKWEDPEHRALMQTSRDKPEYRAAKSERMKQIWAERGGFAEWIKKFSPEHQLRIKQAIVLSKARPDDLDAQQLDQIATETDTAIRGL
jgi:hypothetical protein